MSPRAPRTGAHISASSFAEPRALTSDEWVEPRSPREQDLQVRLLRTQKELHRARSELARRTEAHAERQKKDSTGKAEEGKPDWTLALRYRLTAELRAEMNRLETGWAADKRSYTKTLTELQSKFERTKTEKEAMISRLLKEVLELQRLYARANAQREMFHVIESTEIRNAERERETHVEMARRKGWAVKPEPEPEPESEPEPEPEPESVRRRRGTPRHRPKKKGKPLPVLDLSE